MILGKCTPIQCLRGMGCQKVAEGDNCITNTTTIPYEKCAKCFDGCLLAAGACIKVDPAITGDMWKKMLKVGESMSQFVKRYPCADQAPKPPSPVIVPPPNAQK